MNSLHAIRRYAVAGGLAGALLGVLVLTLGGLLFVGCATTNSSDIAVALAHGPLWITLTYAGGGIIGGAIWGALHGYANSVGGLVLVTFATAIPLFALLSIAAGSPTVLGALARAGALAVIVGAGQFASRIRISVPITTCRQADVEESSRKSPPSRCRP